MKVIKSDKRIAEEEAELAEKENKEVKARELTHKSWIQSSHFGYVIDLLDVEINKANNNSAIPKDMSFEERGQYSMAMAIAHDRLLNIKKTLVRE